MFMRTVQGPGSRQLPSPSCIPVTTPILEYSPARRRVFLHSAPTTRECFLLSIPYSPTQPEYNFASVVTFHPAMTRTISTTHRRLQPNVRSAILASASRSVSVRRYPISTQTADARTLDLLPILPASERSLQNLALPILEPRWTLSSQHDASNAKLPRHRARRWRSARSDLLPSRTRGLANPRTRRTRRSPRGRCSISVHRSVPSPELPIYRVSRIVRTWHLVPSTDASIPCIH